MNRREKSRLEGVRRAGILLTIPFFLQILGFGNTPLGSGLCGALLGSRTESLSEQGPGFWYAMMFMVLLGFQLMLGALLLLSRVLELPESVKSGLIGVGIVFGILMFVMFLLTRLTGLPVPTSLGMAWGRVEKFDILSWVLSGSGLWASYLLLRVRASGAE